MGKKPAAKTTPESKSKGNLEGAEMYVQGLPKQKSQLIILRDELYDGSWNSMLEDLDDRRNSRPYIFKLVNRIEEDIKWCRELWEAEEKFGVNLSLALGAPPKKRRS